MASLTQLDLRLGFAAEEITEPWFIKGDETTLGWTIKYQLWGMCLMETRDHEQAITVQMTLDTRNRMSILVTLLGVGILVWKSEVVRMAEIGLAVSRIVCELLATS